MTDPTLTPHPRPAFDGWLTLHRKDYAWAAAHLNRSREYVRRICLPFDDETRLDPSGRVVRNIIRLTDGAVTGDDWHPPVAELLSMAAAA
jgi:hypothetical protein